MSVTAEDPVAQRPGGAAWLWKRQLSAYPDTGPRTVYLAITVLATITLYYELYVGASVSTLLLTNATRSASCSSPALSSRPSPCRSCCSSTTPRSHSA